MVLGISVIQVKFISILFHRRTMMFCAKMAASTMSLVVLVVLVSVGEFQPEHL